MSAYFYVGSLFAHRHFFFYFSATKMRIHSHRSRDCKINVINFSQHLINCIKFFHIDVLLSDLDPKSKNRDNR